MIPMTRREALKAATALAGGVLIAPVILTGCTPEGREAASGGLILEDQALIEDIADTLLPTTAASPGAKAAGVGATIILILTDCHAPDVQQRVAAGLHALRTTCRERGAAGFGSLTRPERERLLRELDAAAQKMGEAHWFAVTRQLALHAYFTSEIGLTRATRYALTPGRWEGCVPLVAGQPAWA